jgi:uncharacterized protein involved in outer membrane biogenesis
MARRTGRIVWMALGASALLVIAACVALPLLNADQFHPRLEAAATRALGMPVRIGGRMSVGFDRGVCVTVPAVQVLDARGKATFSAPKVRAWFALMPLFKLEFRVNRIDVTRPAFSIVRERDGMPGPGGAARAAALVAALEGARVSLSNGSVRYVDHRSGERFEADSIDLAVDLARDPRPAEPWSLAHVSLTGKLSCAGLRTKSVSATSLRGSFHGSRGIFVFDPVSLRVFGGTGTGSLGADFTGPVPAYTVRFALPSLRLEEFLRTVSSTPVAEGAVAFTAHLATRGTSTAELVRSVGGTASLRGRDLVFLGSDLDRSIARFESTRNLNLADAGALFFTGPLGLAVTRGLVLGNVLRPSGGRSPIVALVSQWRIERGVATATDVALSTRANRLALEGRLDFVHARFEDVIVAVVDTKGRAAVRQSVHGTFARPVVQKPHLLLSLAGPAVGLYRRARSLVPIGGCTPFYTGSVPAPHR